MSLFPCPEVAGECLNAVIDMNMLLIPRTGMPLGACLDVSTAKIFCMLDFTVSVTS